VNGLDASGQLTGRVDLAHLYGADAHGSGGHRRHPRWSWRGAGRADGGQRQRYGDERHTTTRHRNWRHAPGYIRRCPPLGKRCSHDLFFPSWVRRSVPAALAASAKDVPPVEHGTSPRPTGQLSRDVCRPFEHRPENAPVDAARDGIAEMPTIRRQTEKAASIAQGHWSNIRQRPPRKPTPNSNRPRSRLFLLARGLLCTAETMVHPRRVRDTLR
jgi:hypothetical protein